MVERREMEEGKMNDLTDDAASYWPTRPIDRALDDVQCSMDSATELRRPENKVAHAIMVWIDACDLMRRTLREEDTGRLAAMEERDGGEETANDRLRAQVH